MVPKMKKHCMRRLINIAALLTLVMVLGVSCDKEQSATNKGYPILFKCPDVTRAEANLTDIQAGGFDVYAFYQTSVAPVLGFDKYVYYENSIWKYDDVEYWIPGATYWFKAIYPSGDYYTLDNTSSTQNIKIENFDITSQTDIMTAETDRNGLEVDWEIGAPQSGSEVKLNFSHLLANVVIKVKAEVNVTINDITLRRVKKIGTYNNGLWSYSSEGTIAKSINMPLTTADKEGVDVTDGGLLVIPGNAAGVVLDINTSHQNNTDIEIPQISWEKGKRYTYTLTIKQNDIIFKDSPEVAVWDETNATGSVIIK